MNINYRTFQDMSYAIRNGIHKLPADLDLIVGIPRSGVIPAYMIALFLNKRACSLDEYIRICHGEGTIHEGERPMPTLRNNDRRKVLIVDDSVHSGVSLNKVKSRLAEGGYWMMRYFSARCMPGMRLKLS